jgi:hypothetical protein
MLKNPLKVSSEIPVEFEAPAEKSQYKTDLGEKITFQVGESRSGRHHARKARVLRSFAFTDKVIWGYLIF